MGSAHAILPDTSEPGFFVSFARGRVVLADVDAEPFNSQGLGIRGNFIEQFLNDPSSAKIRMRRHIDDPSCGAAGDEQGMSADAAIFFGDVSNAFEISEAVGKFIGPGIRKTVGAYMLRIRCYGLPNQKRHGVTLLTDLP